MKFKDSPRAAGYVRVSTLGQASEGESLSTQKKQIEAFAESKGWKLVEIYEDAGISGNNAENRPSLNQLLKDSRTTGHFDYVIITKFSRFARNTRDFLTYRDQFRKSGVELVSIQDNIDASTYTGELMLTLLAAVAQWEREVIREQMAENKIRRWQEHRAFIGKVPFGYRWNKENKKLQIDREEAEIYKRMVTMYVEQRLSSVSIAIQLRKERIRCKKALFTYSTILFILKNPCYYGEYFVNTRVFKDDKRGAGRKRSKEEKPADLHIKFPIPPLITKTEWDEIQAQMEENKIKRKHVTKNADAWLRAFLSCGICGAKMLLVPGWKHKDGPSRKDGSASKRYYACYWRRASKRKLEANDRARCKMPYVDADNLKREVWASILRPLDSPVCGGETIEQLPRLGFLDGLL